MAGVVSGADMVSRCFKHLTLMRVPQVGAGAACTPLCPPARSADGLGCHFSKAVEVAGACLRVVPGTNAHTKGVTETSVDRRGGQVVESHLSVGRNAPGEDCSKWMRGDTLSTTRVNKRTPWFWVRRRRNLY